MRDSKLIICGQLYDGVHADLARNAEILVEGSVITAVGKNLSRPRDCQVLDLGDMTVTPGMIDAHIHSDIFDWRNYSDILMRGETWNNLGHLHTAQRSLERGFTTIRAHALAQGRGYGLADVRRAIDAGYFQGARMVITFHMLGSPGSHADASQAILNPHLSDAATQPFIGSGADFFRQVVRKDIKYGADFVKLFLSGGFSTPGDSPENTYLSDEEIQAIISTARDMNRPTTAHVYTPAHMQKLIRFGITGMEHGSLMDEETAALFEETNTYLVPTFCPYNEIIHLDEAALAQKEPHFQVKLRKYAHQLRKGRQIIANSKIRLGYGTDFVAVHQCYESWYEYQSWMRSGIDPFRILKAATSTNAEILGLQDRLGAVEPGKLADLSGWRRDLLRDEDALSQCAFVMKGGVRCRALHGTQGEEPL